MRNERIVIDLFCGAGGESCGIHEAFAKKGEGVRLFAVNHWATACETHAANFPADECICQDITTMIPRDLVKDGQPVELMWASPACTHHSVARGGKPMDDQSRCTPFNILEWCTELDVKRLIVENVPEFLAWGPLGTDMRPVQAQKGLYFGQFISWLRGIGYQVDWRVLNAADFGAPTTRRRLFIQAAKKGSGKRLVWPEATNAERPESDDLFGSTLRPWVPASEVIDWSIPCQPIDDRERPLAAKTMRRIMSGIAKYFAEELNAVTSVDYADVDAEDADLKKVQDKAILLSLQAVKEADVKKDWLPEYSYVRLYEGADEYDVMYALKHNTFGDWFKKGKTNTNPGTTWTFETLDDVQAAVAQIQDAANGDIDGVGTLEKNKITQSAIVYTEKKIQQRFQKKNLLNL